MLWKKTGFVRVKAAILPHVIAGHGLKSSMVDYQSLYDDMPSPRFRVKRGEDKRLFISLPNDKARAFWGGLDGAGVWPVYDLLASDYYHDFARSFDVCLSTGASVSVDLQPALPLASGAQRAARPFMIFPVSDAKGRICCADVIGGAGLARPGALQEGRDDELVLMSAVFDMSEVGIVVTDDAHKIVRVNQSVVRHFGWDEDELIGHDIIDFVTPDVRQVMASQQKAGVNAPRGSGELRVIRSDGSVANVLFTAAAMKLSGGRIFQVYTLMDITLRKRMEETLRSAKERADSASRAKSVFLANMSHELRTPLNAIMGFSEIMMHGTFGAMVNERYAGYVGDIYGSAAHLLDIINEVLDMSKIESGKIELDEDWHSVSAIVQDVVRMMESRAFGKSILFKVESQDDLPALLCDRRIVRQILINLIVNAVKFSHEGGVITIKLLKIPKRGDLQILVIDQGRGIAEDKIARVLEPFGQAEDADEYMPQEGTGLGLPLAKAMTELHGGGLRLRSALGQGTEVSILFPKGRLRGQKA